ncbi:hemin uptake protein HemP [Methylomicrobium album]
MNGPSMHDGEEYRLRITRNNKLILTNK